MASPLWQRAVAGAQWLQEQERRTVTVVHHIDADGVASGAVALACLERAGIGAEPLAVRSLDELHIARVREAAADALWFCDLGSAAYMHFPDTPRLVCDHHQLVRDGGEEAFPHVNPLLDELPGSDVSGAGAAFLVALALDPQNIELLPLALVGAAGDLQDREEGRFTGSNGAIAAAGEEAGLLCHDRELGWFGAETRPIRKFLALGRDPTVPGVTGSQRTAESFLLSCDVAVAGGDGVERTWSGLSTKEQERLRGAIAGRILDCGLGPLAVDRLWRDRIIITAEAEGTPMRELQEFATLLNATARYDRPDVGLAVARGDRAAAFEEALGLLGDHRKHLVGALDAFAQVGVQETPEVQWVHLEDRVRDTVVGIVCGMALDGLGLRKDKPIVGFAYTPDGRTKVSSRAPRTLQRTGIDLAAAMREAAAAVGGQGGGHKGAAGATIPRGSEAEFLERVDAVLAARPLIA